MSTIHRFTMYMNSDLVLPATSSGTINNMSTLEETFF